MNDVRARFWCAAFGLVALIGASLPAVAAEKESLRKPRLQLLILANNADEPKAIEAAKRDFADVKKDAKRQEELDRRAKEGLPPPPVAVATDKGPGYTWVEIGPTELRGLRLDKEPSGDEENPEWQRVADARKKGETIATRGAGLLYSRPCVNRALSEKERATKKVDYFLLTRDPRKGKAITGFHLERVKTDKDLRGSPAVSITLNKEGGNLLFELTTENRPMGAVETAFRRQLAIVVDGRVVSSPYLLSPIRAQATITGSFTKADVEAMVAALKSDLAKDKK